MRADWLRRVLVAVTVTASLCLVGSANALAAGGQNPIVVIVPGLDMAVPGMSPTSGGCGGQGSLGALCQAYVNQGYDVYIPSTSTTGNGTVINSTGNVAVNASALTDYVNNIEDNNNGADVSAVGYSMGGLMVVDAVRDNGMAVNSIVTIGSPLDGSFVADGLTAAANMPCGFSAGCELVSAGAQLAINQAGPDAVSSLTSADRAAENAGQDPVGVPMTTIAGNGCGIAGDCLVSVSSAYGSASGLGPTTQLTVDDVHTGGPGGVLGYACGGCSPELNDPAVAAAAVKASQSGCSGSAYCIPSPQALGRLALARARRLATRHAHSRAPRTVALPLSTASLVSIAAGSSQTISGSSLIASTSPYAVACAGSTPVAPGATASPLYYTDTALLGCASGAVTVANQGSQAITVETFTNPENAQATVGAQGAKRVPIKVTAAAGITTVKIVTHGGKVLDTVNGAGRHSVSFTVPRTVASGHILSVTLAGQPAVFAATIPTLQAALVKGTLTVRPRSVRAGHTVTITGTDWATGTVHLTLIANGSTHYVLATQSVKATARNSFTVTWTAPSSLTARTPIKVIAGEPQRAPATAKFVVTPAGHH